MKHWTTGTVAVAALLTGCGGHDSPSASTESHYRGPGSVWDVTLNTPAPNTFNIKKYSAPNGTLLLDVDGNYTVKPSNLLEMTATTVNTGSGVSPGDVGIGLEAPDYALFMDFGGQLIPMVHLGTCPTVLTRWNTLPVTQGTGSPTPRLRQVSYDPSAGTISIAAYDTTSPFSYLSGSSYNASCANGVITFTNGSGESIEGYLSPSGAFVARNLNNGGIFYGVQLPAAPIPALASNDLDGTYTGMQFDGINAPSYIKMTCASNSCTGNKIDVDDNATSPAQGFTLIADPTLPNARYVRTTVGSDSAICTVDLNVNGKHLLDCVEIAVTPPGSYKNFVLYQR